ncbi:HelD family protein, partial [Micromonospora zhanjiangensis]
MLYDRLDDLRRQAARRLATALRNTGGTRQEQSQRDSNVGMYAEQVDRYGAVENGLCFGRLDFHDGEPLYIGRLGIFDDSHDYEPLLLDWRAPAARPFYLATAAAPEGVRRRRHIRSRLRTVTGLDDEVLDLDAPRSSRHEELTGEAVLLAALNASRTGRMGDIVETIQAEQDRVIRSDLAGVLVVQGGPGTGKTAVALHRAAYLLYTYREQLAGRGVLIVGPNPTFLHYISQVLPALAETGVLLRTVGDLFPGVGADRTEPDEVAEIKGRVAMAEVLAAAVRDRQVVPDEPLEIVFDQERYLLDPATCAAARDRVRRTGKVHNLARPLFEVEIAHALAELVADRIGIDPYADDPLGGDDAPGDPQILAEADLAEIRRELHADPEVRAVLDRLWPVLSPQRLLTDLFGSAERLATAAPQLTDAERGLLLRGPDWTGWTEADVPLLDEAAELLGEDERAIQARQERERRQRIEYAEGALEIARGSQSIDLEDAPEDEAEILTATDLIDADRLADRQEYGDGLSTAQRAAADRRWAFGHIIVDEAQELSPMAWRLLMRRIPSRSMTLVGDVAQTGSPAGTAAWDTALEPYVGGRWRLAQLTVSYPTPAEIMALAAKVLAEIDPTLEPPRSVRETGEQPRDETVRPAALAGRLVELVRDEATRLDDG